MRDQLEEFLALHSGRSKEQVAADIERDTVLTAQQALEYGLVDHIVENRTATLRSPDAR